MKILSWNIGNFIWSKHLPRRQHYSFYTPNLPEVSALIKKENADTVFLQEIHTEEDAHIIFESFPEFKHKTIVYSQDRFSKSIFMSKYEIEHIHHTENDDYIIGGISFFTVHLNAFSPEKRYRKVLRILDDLQHSKTVILGDTNFWIIKDRFLSSRDRLSYNKITSNHKDILKSLGPTCRMFMALDKIFITEDLSSENEKIVKHNIGQIDHYMVVADINIV
jgi:endonuclease/exonuclease/phosphatase family metal-dependent hydrolase